MQLMVAAALPSFLQERERDKFETEHITAGMFSASFIYVGVGNGWASLSLETPDLKNCDCSFSPNGVINYFNRLEVCISTDSSGLYLE